MNEPIVSIFDIETDDIDAKIIRCLSFYDVNTKTSATITDYDVMRKYFQRKDVYFCGHHIIGFDIPVVERLLGIKVTNPVIDTLALSWTLSSNRNSHGLQSYGDEYGIEKPKIDDYAKQDIEEIKRRCSQDVLINLKVWENQKWYLNELYDGNWEQILKYIGYLTFKLQCVAKQQELGVKLDIPLVKETLMNLEDLKIQKTEALTAAMPKQPIKTIKKYPKVFKKANGELSTNGQKWVELVKEKGFPEDYKEDIEVITGYNDGNPNSHAQIKNWLFDLGWEPGWYKYVKEEGKSEMRKIPQVASKDEPGEVCESIKKLIEKEPALEELSSLGIISHRISIFKGFLRDQKDGRIYQGIQGLTNTLRLQHSGIVNLPNISKPYSENVRKCLIADNNKLMIGCDLSGIEDNTKRHYIYKYDPAYVETMNNPDFDPHLDIAVLAGFLTSEQAENHKLYEKTKKLHEENPLIPIEGKSYKEVRQKAKTANFALTYKCGVATLARQTGLKEKEAKKLTDIYWKRNKAILDVENELKTKQIGNQKWILNPVSNFWYSLRAEKDKFSTLNQGTAVYCFDRWLYYIKNQKIKINFQVHDEWTSNLLETEKELYTEKINKALEEVNNELQLNIKIGCSIDFGINYTECH